MYAQGVGSSVYRTLYPFFFFVESAKKQILQKKHQTRCKVKSLTVTHNGHSFK